MKYRAVGSRVVVRIDAGEKIVETLRSLCEREGIGSGFFQGLGAVSEAELGHFEPASGDYSWTKLSGPHEIVSLYGNVTTLDGKPFIHVHASLGDGDFNVKGGHLREAVVSATCEVVLTRFKGDIGRARDAATGLSLLELERDGE